MGNSTDNTFFVGFDLGGTKMLAKVFDDQFKSAGQKRRRTKGHEGVDAGVERIAETIAQALDDANVERKQLSGIGIGCPAPVDMERGIVLDAVNLGWKNVRLRKALENKFGCGVVVVNDVDAGVYAENKFGVAKNARCVVGVFPGTGIGGGCVYDGQILHGPRSSAMEIGHIQVNPNGRLCGCGRHGCLESEASRLAISAMVAQAAYRGQAPYVMKKVGTDLSQIRSGVLAAAIEAGDEIVERIVRDACGHVGTAVATVVNLLLPEIVVLGGGLVDAMPELFVDTVRKSAKEKAMPSLADSFKVVPAKLGDDATVLGAAAWAEQSLSKMTKSS